MIQKIGISGIIRGSGNYFSTIKVSIEFLKCYPIYSPKICFQNALDLHDSLCVPMMKPNLLFWLVNIGPVIILNPNLIHKSRFKEATLLDCSSSKISKYPFCIGFSSTNGMSSYEHVFVSCFTLKSRDSK